MAGHAGITVTATTLSTAANAQPFSAAEVAALRADFPILHQQVNGKPLAYLDNGASAQHPRSVIDAEADYYRHDHSNIHRGVHTLSQRATDAFEAARHKLQRFINARSEREVILTRGTTESINLIAQAWGRTFLQPGANGGAQRPALLQSGDYSVFTPCFMRVLDTTGCRGWRLLVVLLRPLV
jgi:hypothetical protein